MNILRIGFILLSLSAIGQPAEEILEAHFQKYGQAIWSEIYTLEVEGNWVTDNFDKFPVKITMKAPNRIRMEGLSKGLRFVESFDGLASWTTAPWNESMRAQRMTPSQLLVLNNTFSFGSPLFPYKEKLMLLGLEAFEGSIYLHFRFEDSTLIHDYYLGKDDFLLYWEVIQTKGTEPIAIKKQFEKYRNHQGLLAPTSVRIITNTEKRELTFENIVLGIGVNDSYFKAPVK